MSLLAKVQKLEAAFPSEEGYPRIVRLVTSEEDRGAAIELARSQGYDPETDLFIIRLIVGQHGKDRIPPEPYLR